MFMQKTQFRRGYNKRMKQYKQKKKKKKRFQEEMNKLMINVR